MKCTRIAVGCLALALAAGPAWAQDEEFDDGGSFDRGSFASPDDLRGKTVRMDDLKKEPPAALDQGLSGGSAPLDDFEGGGSRSIEQTLEKNRGWQPPPCDAAPRAGAGTPADEDLEGWSLALGTAQEELAKQEERWRKLELGAVRVRVEDRFRQAEANREARDKAREAYAKSRCDLVDLVLLARRANVPPGTLRPFVQQMPADLNPF